MSHASLGIGPGSIVQDSYEIKRILGEGGMGATFSGKNLATDHDVAIKVILPQFARDNKAGDLFRREANLLRTIQNEAVVRYETTILDKAGRLYLVMEYIDGKPLSSFLNRGARLDALGVLRLGKRLAGGLEAIHRLGIVHRDLSPDNIIIPADDILGAKLIDFGVASDTIGTDKSILGDTFAGKISYASPEQLGLGEAPVSTASDVYSLGLVLLRTAGCEVPGAGGSLADAIDKRRRSIFVDPSLPSPVLRRMLESLLRANPANRPEKLVTLFDEAIREEQARLAQDAAAPSEKPKEKSQTASSATLAPFDDEEDGASLSGTGTKRPPLALLGGLAALVVVGGGLGAFFLFGDLGPNRAEEQADVAKTAAQADDPLQEITALIDAGGADNLNAAFGALMALARDDTQPQSLRASAAMAIAEMYDPETYSETRSPFPGPNPSAAQRFYEEADSLGAAEAASRLSRLSD